MAKKATISVDGFRYLLHTIVRRATLIDIENWEAEHLVIPSLVSFQGQVFDVATIASEAFCGCENLLSVTLPDSLISISNLFHSCRNLTSVTILKTVKKIGRDAFVDCPRLNLVIPDTVTSIEKGAFRGKIKSITFSNRLATIEKYAFSGCTNLTSIVIPNSVTSIGAYAFTGCRRLASAVIPAIHSDDIESVERRVFNEYPNVVFKYSAGGFMELSDK